VIGCVVVNQCSDDNKHPTIKISRLCIVETMERMFRLESRAPQVSDYENISRLKVGQPI
jgi:hypothetical protein